MTATPRGARVTHMMCCRACALQAAGGRKADVLLWYPAAAGVGTIINQFERLWQPLMGGCDGSARANRKQREREMEAEKRRG